MNVQATDSHGKKIIVKVPVPKPNIIINANQLVADLQRGVRHDEMSPFSFSVELAQATRGEFFWRAYVSTDGRVRDTTKLVHTTPGAAIDELWCKLKGDD